MKGKWKLSVVWKTFTILSITKLSVCNTNRKTEQRIIRPKFYYCFRYILIPFILLLRKAVVAKLALWLKHCVYSSDYRQCRVLKIRPVRSIRSWWVYWLVCNNVSNWKIRKNLTNTNRGTWGGIGIKRCLTNNKKFSLTVRVLRLISLNVCLKLNKMLFSRHKKDMVETIEMGG